MGALATYWPFAMLAHAIAAMLFAVTPSTSTSLCRVAVALATSFNVLVSDRYHNQDLSEIGASLRDEIYWFRYDLIFISAVMNSTLLLWAAHSDWVPPYPLVCSASCLANVLVAILAAFLFETDKRLTCWHDPVCARGVRTWVRNRLLTHPPPSQPRVQRGLPSSPIGKRTLLGELLVKGILGVQFLALDGFMAYRMLSTSCHLVFYAWFAYLPGIICYSLHIPKDNHLFGPHDIFHVCVIAGHCISAGLDLARTTGYLGGACRAS
jgi:hypothetical protein